jgi:molybdopterin molybdotransferase
MRGFRDRALVEDVQKLLAKRLQPLEAELVDLHEASGRVLASDRIADVAVPAFDRAAMDGYALRGQETVGADPYHPLEFAIVGLALPGRPFAGSVGPGQVVRVMTGAPLPAGADAVLPAEEASEAAGRLCVSDPVPPGRHVGRRGEDIEPGTVVLHAGRVLRPQDLGVLASIGGARVAVVRRPSVALLITGDELLRAGSPPEPYRIVDSNSVMLDALVRRDGGLPWPAQRIPDTRAAVEAALLGARADVLLVSGGSSVGQEDHAPAVVAAHGDLAVHGVAMRPASPAGVGFLGSRPVFLLPGNPVACLCAYDFFAGPALRRLGGRRMEWPYPARRLPLAHKIASVIGRVEYVRVLVRDGRVEPLARSGASVLSSTTRADGFVVVPGESEGYAEGQEVDVFLYDSCTP